MSQPLLKYREPVMAQDILTEAVPARLYTEGSGLNLARAALFGVGLDKVRGIVELLRTYRGGKPNSLIMGGPMGWSWYATLDTAHHGALAGPANAHRHSDLASIGIDDHHARDHATRHHSGGADALALGSIAGNLTDAQHGVRTLANAHAHSHLSGIGANDHHNRYHALIDTTGHTVSGLTIGHFLKATGATSYAFQAHGLSAGDVGAAAAIHNLIDTTNHPVSGLTIGHVIRASGAAAYAFAQLSHGDLGGVTADQHHAQSHTHASHTGIGANDHHAQSHSHASHTGIGASDHHVKTADNEVYGLLSQGLAAARPAAGIAGRLYYSTDTQVLERDTGVAWEEKARGETATRLAQLSEKAHGSLTGVTADQHHAQAHTLASHSTKAHAELTGIGASDHHVKYTDAEAVTAAKADADVADAITKKHTQNTDTDLSPAHKNATTGVHGVGASTVESASGAQSKVDTHAALTTAHSAVSTATASRMVVRDASARAKFAAPAASGDALIKGTALTATELPNLTSTKIWQGNGSNRPVEVALDHGGLDGLGDDDHTQYLLKQMAENDPLLLDAAISGDGYYSGICEAGVAGAALVFGNLCYLAVADSRWEKTDANAIATANAKLGICVLAAAGDGSATRMLLFGKVNAASLYPTLTVGAKVFLGETAGNIQVAAPTGITDVIRVVGFANTADELFFCPEAAPIDIINDTAGGTNGAIYKAASANVVFDHGALQTAHGAVSAATASKMVVRDASARAKFAAPGAAGDALIKGTALTITEMAALTTGKIWQGVASRPSEVDAYTDAAAVAAVAAAGVSLASGKSITILSALSANDTCSGTVIRFISGEIMDLGEAGYLKGADSRVWKALATGIGTMPAIVLAFVVPAAGALSYYLLQGTMRHDAWNWTPGGLLYVSRTTAGALTQTAPSTPGDLVQAVGVAITADIILFNPSCFLDIEVVPPAALTVAETEVFNGKAPTSWTDLDLSGTVGLQATLVLVKVLAPTYVTRYAFRRNGDTDELYGNGFETGAHYVHGDPNVFGIAIVLTDTSGVIEWKSSSANYDMTVDVIGYIK